jgi:OmpA-OmpF porin, OOP family
MRKIFAMKQVRLAAACALALGVMSGTASAQKLAPINERALVTGPADQVWMNGYGECWHSGFGPGPSPNLICGPQPNAKYVAPAPAPAAQAAPVVVAAAAPEPVREKVTLNADTLFDFDKAVLRQEGRDALDAFVGKLQGAELGTITAVGHTDRLGTSGYNQTLSDKRAAAVKDYLVAKGIEPDRVQVKGVGEAQPVTKAGECPSGKSAKVISCLQPDRRVEVEVSGTRPQQ